MVKVMKSTMPAAISRFFILVLAAISCTPEKADQALPNILFIMADDHANRTISAYGQNINQTPNIDRIANEGAIFLNSFCGNSICAPSRASILTGKHSHRNKVYTNSSPWNGEQTQFPKLLGQAGYETALIGKWHLKSDPGSGFGICAAVYELKCKHKKL